jgi:hypothetical protein
MEWDGVGRYRFAGKSANTGAPGLDSEVENPTRRVGTRLNPRDHFEMVVGFLKREIGGLNRDQSRFIGNSSYVSSMTVAVRCAGDTIGDGQFQCRVFHVNFPPCAAPHLAWIVTGLSRVRRPQQVSGHTSNELKVSTSNWRIGVARRSHGSGFTPRTRTHREETTPKPLDLGRVRRAARRVRRDISRELAPMPTSGGRREGPTVFHRTCCITIATASLWLAQTSLAVAQQPPPPTPAATPAAAPDEETKSENDRHEKSRDENHTKPNRLFGVLPNTSTIEVATPVSPITTKQSFAFATQDSFDKNVFPFVGVVAVLGVGQPSESYWKRYATAMADNTIGNFMSTAVLPSLLHQDPRYFQLGTGSIWHRATYAATRSVITLSREGHSQFNMSEIGGNAFAGMLSNAYYPAPERSPANTMARVGSQIMWDTVSYECKEFWPDIRRMLQRKFHRL